MSAQPWTVEEAGLGAAGDFKHFWFVEGVILDQSSSSETSVYRDSLGSISSKTYISQDIWINTETEGETRIRLNKAIPIRPGQEAVIVYYRKHIRRSESCFLYIKNTKELYEISSKPILSSTSGTAKAVMIGIAISVAICVLGAFAKSEQMIIMSFIAFAISIIVVPFFVGIGHMIAYNNIKNNLLYKYLSEGGDLTVNPPVKDPL